MLLLLIAHESQKTQVKYLVFEISFLLLLTQDRGKGQLRQIQGFL